MKRLFILASAAIVALAACTKTEVVYTEAPAEIGFKQITDVMTKAVPDGTQLPATMGVYAYKGSDAYFSNISYSDKTTYWGATDDNEKAYWPLDNSDLTFTVYAPHNANAQFATNVLTIPNVTNATDVLYGKTQPTGNKTTNATTPVDVELGHAFAQVLVVFKAAANVELNSVTFNDVVQGGTCNVTYPGATVAWDALTAAAPVELLASANLELTSDAEYPFLAVPATLTADHELTFEYTLSGSPKQSHTITKTQLSTAEWVEGKRYVYNITIGATEIQFNPRVEAWDANVDGNPGDDKVDLDLN